MNEPEEPKHQLPATIPSAEVTTDQRASNVVPALIADLGDEAAWRYVEFFTANIRNPHTRRAYARACSQFFAWCDQRGLTLTAIRPHSGKGQIQLKCSLSTTAPASGQRLLYGRAFADGKRQGKQRQDGRQGRHRDRPQAIAAGLRSGWQAKVRGRSRCCLLYADSGRSRDRDQTAVHRLKNELEADRPISAGA